MTFLRWIVSLAILAMWCALIGTGLYVAMYEPPEDAPRAQAIVVLGGGVTDNGTLTPNSAERVAFGVELFEAGVAPLMVLTGGGPIPEAPLMAEQARAAGIPDEALLVEPASRSTLQNALFTGDFDTLDKTQPVLLVSQRFHLPRAWASFRWAGFQSVEIIAADGSGEFTIDRNLLWESVKWPFNILRGAAASAAMAGNVPRESWIAYLE